MSSSSPPTRAQLCSAWLGNLFEHYDTALFGFLSPFIAPLIFPNNDPLTALILTFAIIPLGMLARPLGAIFFGYLGDRYGRNQALFLSLAGMSIISGCLAVSPTYAQAGLLSPLIFSLARLLQNFLASGEIMGGAIFLLENTPERRRDLFSGLYNSSTIGGILLASGGVSVIGYYGVVDIGWRLLYVFGCLTALFGCFIRRQFRTDYAPESKIMFSQTFHNLKSTLWSYRKPFFLIAIAAGFDYANYSIALVVVNGFVPLVTSLSKAEIMGINTILLILDFCALPLFGLLASKVSREKMMLGASLGVTLCAIPLFMLFEGADLPAIIALRIGLVVFGIAFCAPFNAWAMQLIPHSHRYVIISLAYALGSQLLGSPTAAISLWLYQQTGLAWSVAWYWVALATASSVAIAITLKKRAKALI